MTKNSKILLLMAQWLKFYGSVIKIICMFGRILSEIAFVIMIYFHSYSNLPK